MPDPYSPENVVRGLFDALNARDYPRALSAIEWTSTGTFKGVFRGRLPNGKSFRRRGCSVAEVRHGQIVHYRDYFDRVGILQQLELMDLL